MGRVDKEALKELNKCLDEPYFQDTTGKNHIADQLFDQGEGAMSHMAVGTGSTAPAAGDTALETELIDVKKRRHCIHTVACDNFK